MLPLLYHCWCIQGHITTTSSRRGVLAVVADGGICTHLQDELSTVSTVILSSPCMCSPSFRKVTVGNGLPLTSQGRRMGEGSVLMNLTTSGSNFTSNCTGAVYNWRQGGRKERGREKGREGERKRGREESGREGGRDSLPFTYQHTRNYFLLRPKQNLHNSKLYMFTTLNICHLRSD